MKLTFTQTGWEDYVHWQTADRTMLKRINRLIDAMLRDPFEGIGKPKQSATPFPGHGPGGSPGSTAWFISSRAIRSSSSRRTTNTEPPRV